MRRSIFILLVAAIMLSALSPLHLAMAQSTAEGKARALLAKLTPEERVGQLFLVSFQGSDVGDQSQIYDLITRHHVGGVILLAGNDNFVAAPYTMNAAYDLIAGLQQIKSSQSLESVQSESAASVYAPLLVGTTQQGDGLPIDQILSGLSPIPPEMALGATWDPAQASDAGAAMGRELEALGFNLFLGPSLDVATTPVAVLQGDVGTYAFGGDPFWVGKMGQSYIEGLHAGSSGRIAVIARNFPGGGDADRLPNEEVATVRKSLEQLKQVELAPFFAVTGNAPSAQMTTDGLLVTHIRYQGFQGNIRATTRPVSFDQQALGLIMSLAEFGDWRSSGGIIVSDDLGSRSVQRFYDPSGLNFSALVVARDAFLAGSDLLYMGNIISSDDKSNYETVIRAVSFFTQKYREDPAFAQRVDESALRILTLKFRLYPTFDVASVVPSSRKIQVLGQSVGLTDNIARLGATLLSPNSSDLAAVLPDPPKYRDRIVFITDNRTGSQCSTCSEQPLIATDALQAAVLRLYGSQGGAQVAESRLSSFTFDDMAAIMQGGSGNVDFENALSAANWVVISGLDLPPNQPNAQVLSSFLSERANLLRDKRIIMFSFSAPYYLDATDISKFTAYFNLYGKSQPYIDTAARLLFKEITPSGKSPVSVPGIDYDLIKVTSPAPGQLILIYLDLPPDPTPGANTTPEPTSVPLFAVGDAISVRTGKILDNNGNSIPDGTVVTFSLTREGGVVNQVEAETKDGVASTSFRLDKSGLAEIRATSDPATSSVVLQIDVTPGEAVAVTVIVPTQQTVIASTPLPTPTVAQPEEIKNPLVSKGFPLLSAWLLAMILILFGAGMVFIIISQMRSLLWALRWTLCVVLGGLAAYNYSVFGLPGSAKWIESSGFAAILIMLVTGMSVGLLAAYSWERIATRNKAG
jgi:beta-N-acetylhexosaminidase